MALVGNLKDLKLPVIIQLNCMEKNVAMFIVQDRQSEGRIYFDDGNIVHASYGSMEGDEAVYKILSIKAAPFKVENDIKAPNRSVTSNWSNLLMEGLKRLDEEVEQKTELMAKLIKQIMSINGVKGVLICSKFGEILKEDGIASGKRVAAAISFFLNRVEKISRASKGGALKLSVVTTSKDKKVITKWNDDNLQVIVDEKLSVEMLVQSLTRIFQTLKAG